MKARNEIAGLSVWVTMILGILAAMPAQAAGPAPVDLGKANNLVILAKTGISTTGVTAIVGNMGVSPIAATGITGFDLIMDPSQKWSTSSLVAGKIYASDYAAPTPERMTLAVADMVTAYNNAEGRRACSVSAT